MLFDLYVYLNELMRVSRYAENLRHDKGTKINYSPLQLQDRQQPR